MLRNLMERACIWLFSWIATTQAFVVIMVLFLVNALWMAFNAIYPLPFDEYFHYGVIKIYAQQWSPFISVQPPEASIYGDITRLPSYLYHYLMSFPYRLLEPLIPSEEGRIIALRILNIALFAAGIVLFRYLFLKVGVSRRIVHVALLFFVVTPIVPFLAAHINYDNTVMLLAPLALLFGYQIISSRTPDAKRIVYLVILGLLGCLIKETFLPIFGLVALYIGTVLIWRHRGKLPGLIWKQFHKERLWWRLLTVVVLILSIGLFTERYVTNQIRYGDYGAPCEKVQSIEVCSDYMPWYRNYQNKLNPPAEPPFGNPLSFTQHWGSKITRGFFAVFSHTPTQVESPLEPFGPIVLKPLLPLPIVVASLVMMTAVVVVFVQRRRLWANQFYRLSLVMLGGYIFIVWAFNYNTYLSLTAAQAIQARYFLPLLPLAFVVILQSYVWTVHRQRVQMALLIVIGSIYLCSGGILGWLIRADTTWYWQNPTVIEVNQSIQKGIKPFIIH